jgi:hypothetical protein
MMATVSTRASEAGRLRFTVHLQLRGHRESSGAESSESQSEAPGVNQALAGAC